MRREVLRVATIGSLLSLLACAGGTPTDVAVSDEVTSANPGGDTRHAGGSTPASSTSPQFLTVASSAPALESDSVAFWAVQGQERQVELRYAATSGNSQQRFLRFRVRKQTRMRRPDGSLIAKGDSIRISIRVVDAARLLTKFEPAGLRFEGGGSARLWLSYAEVGDDLDGDGSVTSADGAVAQALSIYRREQEDAPWYRVTSTHDFALHELEATITGFTNYVIAY